MRFLKIFLLFNLIFSLFQGCTSWNTALNNEKFRSWEEVKTLAPLSKIEEVKIYEAKMNFFNNELDGLLIVKKQGENHLRIAFTSKIGPRFFDIELKNGAFIKHYVMDYMDKNMLMGTLENDFKLLFLQLESNQEPKYRIKNQHQEIKLRHNNSHVIVKIPVGSEAISIVKQKKNGFTKINIEYENPKTKNERIALKHKRLKISMELKVLQ